MLKGLSKEIAQDKLIDGREVAAKIRRRVKMEVDDLKARDRQPGLAVLLVGDDPASMVYVRLKEKACEEVGIRSAIERVPRTITQDEMVGRVLELNADSRYHGILIQSPLPKHIDEDEVVRAIDPRKDVDGFSREKV
ncbi:hypothetical protein GF324_11535 [bacterium]|nr:hypothetical protein [bacterium]